jgi:DNA-binding helix-hairpin-helix protein with protein kinase domain
MNVFDDRRRPLILGHCIGQGGEATVYQVEGRAELLAKIFEPAPRPNYEAKLVWMMAHPPDNPTQASNHASLAWPAGLLYNSDRRLAGYLMPYMRQTVPALVVFNPRRRSRVLPTFDRRYLYRAARNLATAVASLHLSGYVVGDLNESNILVDPSAMVTLIDTDSFQVQAEERGRLTVHHCPVGKLEYTPPELQGKPLHEVTRLPEHDNFALAVLIFQLLMEGSHPFRAQWLGSGDPPALEVRIRQGMFPYGLSLPCSHSPASQRRLPQPSPPRAFIVISGLLCRGPYKPIPAGERPRLAQSSQRG